MVVLDQMVLELVAGAARVLAENIRRGQAGEPLLNLVDRSRGY